MLPNLPRGELTHATLAAGRTSKAARLDGLAEAFYVISGAGEIWRTGSEGEEVVQLRAGRCVSMPPGTGFQYRATEEEALSFIVAVMPRWSAERWQELGTCFWDDVGRPARVLGGSPSNRHWQTNDVTAKPDYIAPDGSEIRLLPACAAGGLAHCTLRAGSRTTAATHRTVDEIWFVLGGQGEV